jgi:methionine synthase II (cobalamin-independent)
MITKDTYIEDMVRDHPETVTILMQRGVVCIKCGEPVWGTLGETLQRAGKENPDEIIEELNRAVSAE